jgi:pimeloyl-ACP methyl ester carboxylesterase
MGVTRLQMPNVGSGRLTLVLRTLPLLFAVVLVASMARRVMQWQRAARILTKFSATESAATADVAETPGQRPFEFATKPDDVLRWIEYRPRHVRAALLLVHGVQYKGIHEPRLMRFARALASEGILVVTPELPELADYRIDARSIDRIGLVARDLATTEGHAVGIIGTSFAGGLSVMAAAHAAYRPSVRFVFSLGGHEDVDRVSRYLATGEGESPNADPSGVPPHDYGMLVLLHSHAQRFFPAAEVTESEEAITAWLHEDRDVAREHLAHVGDSRLREKLSGLMEHGQRGPWEAEVLADLDAHHDESRSVSPSTVLPRVECPVYLLHGSGDSVIPAIETMYFAADAPRVVKRALVSPAIVHVEVGKGPNKLDELVLVDFLADVLFESEAR